MRGSIKPPQSHYLFENESGVISDVTQQVPIVMRPIRVALSAWQTANHGVNEDFFGHRVVRHKKLVLIMPRTEWWRAAISTTQSLSKDWWGTRGDIVAFPDPKHFKIFRRAARGVVGGGPAKRNPAGIGTLRLRLYAQSENPRFVVSFAQAHFKTSGTHPLQRKLATLYCGWRRHAFAEAVNLASKLGLPLLVSRSTLFPSRRKVKSRAFHKEVLTVAQELGAKVTRKREGHKHFFVVRANPTQLK